MVERGLTLSFAATETRAGWRGGARWGSVRRRKIEIDERTVPHERQPTARCGEQDQQGPAAGRRRDQRPGKGGGGDDRRIAARIATVPINAHRRPIWTTAAPIATFVAASSRNLPLAGVGSVAIVGE